MKSALIILFSSSCIISFAQDTPNFSIGKLAETEKFKCRNASVTDICRSRIYMTSDPDLFYKINYDSEGRVHSQGAVVRDEITEEPGKTRTEYFAVGIWQYYNYAENEIVYFRCVYSNNPGCQLVSKDELKRGKIYLE